MGRFQLWAGAEPFDSSKVGPVQLVAFGPTVSP